MLSGPAYTAGRGLVSSGVFARNGAIWTLSYGGVTVRMRDAKGLADLGLGADEVFDQIARRQIRARLADLAGQIAEAESWNDPEQAVTARIRDVLGRIEQAHPALGAHLRASVTTGTRCSYSPPAPVGWRL